MGLDPWSRFWETHVYGRPTDDERPLHNIRSAIKAGLPQRVCHIVYMQENVILYFFGDFRSFLYFPKLHDCINIVLEYYYFPFGIYWRKCVKNSSHITFIHIPLSCENCSWCKIMLLEAVTGTNMKEVTFGVETGLWGYVSFCMFWEVYATHPKQCSKFERKLSVIICESPQIIWQSRGVRGPTPLKG